ncbi:hypothetical protein JHK85_035496 [Glycine max]|uniref:Secreted protein n=1 Tax=Glycine max TaxID=3847 RepID=A0A0R0H9D7_SOYBN|nr:hypothetical protein JHK85_035496 [Glycine max]KAH1144599.1 hypothetical protein GYH30_034706 [Glycine max]
MVRVLLWNVPFSSEWLLCFLVFFLRKELQPSPASFSAGNPTAARHSSDLLRSIPFLRLPLCRDVMPDNIICFTNSKTLH